MNLFITDKVANPKLLERNNYTKSYEPIQSLRTKKQTSKDDIVIDADGENDFGGFFYCK
jgi:hypothetical protein